MFNYRGEVFGGLSPAVPFFGVVLDGELGLVDIVEESELGGVVELWSEEVEGDVWSEVVPDVLGFDCIVLSEVGGELSGVVPIAC